MISVYVVCTLTQCVCMCMCLWMCAYMCVYVCMCVCFKPQFVVRHTAKEEEVLEATKKDVKLMS